MAKNEKYGTVTFSPTAVTDKEEVHGLHKRASNNGICDWNTMINKPFEDLYDVVSVLYDGTFTVTDNVIVELDKKFGFELGETYRVIIDGEMFGYGLCEICSSGSIGEASFEGHGLSLVKDDNSKYFEVDDVYENGDYPYINGEAQIQYSNLIADENDEDRVIPGVHTLRIEKIANVRVTQIPERFIPRDIVYVWLQGYSYDDFYCEYSYEELFYMMYNEWASLVFVYVNIEVDRIEYRRIINAECSYKNKYIKFHLQPDNAEYIRYDKNGFEYVLD